MDEDRVMVHANLGVYVQLNPLRRMFMSLRRSSYFLGLVVFLSSLATAQTPLRLQNVPPCRLVDTRTSGGGGAFQGTKMFDLVTSAHNGGAYGTCTPFDLSAAQAYSLNVTVIPNGQHLGYLTIWPTGQNQPLVSLMNSPDGRTKANAAIVGAGTNGEVSVYVTNTTNITIDVNAYFDAGSDPKFLSSGLAFYPVTPCRIVDTSRGLGGSTLQPGVPESFSIGGHCNIPSNAAAYSLNFALRPLNNLSVNYMTVWPAGQTRPTVATLNDTTGTIVANAALVPMGTGGQVSAYIVNNPADLYIDTNGYFAAPAAGGLSLYTLTPCRILDTRNGIGAFTGTIPVGIVGSDCGVPNVAEAFTLNASVVPQGQLTYLTLWPEGLTQPGVATLNALDGALTSNMAIVPAGTGNDSIDAFASGPRLTQLILDISSYFAPIAGVNIASSSLPDAVNGSNYSAPLVAIGGVAPYMWTKTGGNLPPGLSVGSNGTISGSAGGSGSYPFTVQASDSNSPAATATASLTITVNTSPGSLAVLTNSLSAGTVNTPYNALLVANGGYTPYTWSIASGGPPAGLTLNGSTGLISGTPGAAGVFNFTAKVTDNLGNTATAPLSVQINTGNANGTLNGMYAGSFTGYDHGNFFVGAISFTADGNGNIIGGETDSNNISSGPKHNTITGGTYCVASNGLSCNGQPLHMLTSNGGTIDMLVATGAAEQMRIIAYNTNGTNGTWGSGVLRQQNPVDFTLSALAGNWAFGSQGSDSGGGAFAVAGTYQQSSGGSITNGYEDVNDSGTHVQETFAGSAGAVDSNGRTTAQLQISGVGTLHYAAYLVSANELVLIQTDSGNGSSFAVTDALRQTGAPFNNGILHGNAVGRESRQVNNNGILVAEASVAVITFDGQGGLTYTQDLNRGGTLTQGTTAGNYMVAANGRTAAGNSVCYVVQRNEGFCIEATSGDPGSLFFEAQAAGPFSAASFSGEYLGGSLPQYISSTLDQIESDLADGLGSFNSSYTQSGPNGTQPNQTLNGTYTVDPSTGAVTITSNGNTVYAGFIVGPGQTDLVSAGPNPLAIIDVTSSAPHHR